jgi:hypothetical protein
MDESFSVNEKNLSNYVAIGFLLICSQREEEMCEAEAKRMRNTSEL